MRAAHNFPLVVLIVPFQHVLLDLRVHDAVIAQIVQVVVQFKDVEVLVHACSPLLFIDVRVP